MPFKPKENKSSFTPPDLMKVNNADPKFTYRWISPHKNTRTFMNGKDERGWEVVRFGSKAEENSALTGLFSQFSNQAVGSFVQIGDLILARMPKGEADSRNEFYREKAKRQLEQIKNPLRKVSDKDKDKFVGDTSSWKQVGM